MRRARTAGRMSSLGTRSAGGIIFRPLVVISLALVLLGFMPTLFHPVRASPTPSFTFTAAGDYGGITTGSHGLTVAQKIALQNPSFHIGLGDLGYGDQSPSTWCSSFKNSYQNLVIVTGNHDTFNSGGSTVSYGGGGSGGSGIPSDVITDEGGPGFLDTIGSSGPGYISACGPPPSGVNWVGSGVTNGGYSCNASLTLTTPSCYGREYYFDYPSPTPIMRFIFISAGIGGPWPDYSLGTTHYNWLKNTIDDAKNMGLWVAVALHKNCLSDGIGHPNCESRFDAFNLALTEKADLWLDGHDHTYQRSFQLDSCSGSGTSVSSCHINNTAQSGPYFRGNGIVVNIIGTGGTGNTGICSTSCSKAQYFASLCGNAGPVSPGCNNDYGFSSFTVTTTQISASYVSATGTFADGYTIRVPNPPGDFGVSANPISLTIPQASSTTTSTTVLSFGGFSGLVTLAAAQSPPNNKFSVCWDGVTCMPARSTNITMIAGESSSATLTVNTGCGTAPGPYAVRVNATSTTPSIFHWVVLPVTVTASACSGSVGAGTLITLADRTQTPVQNLRVGLQLLSYDMTRHEYAITTITRFETVVTYNQMVISTSTGKPLIVDQNPAQRLYAQLPDGMVALVSVTDLQVGYKLFQPLSQTWISITNIQYQNTGIHTMYDVYTTAPGNYIANGYLDPLKDGPH